MEVSYDDTADSSCFNKENTNGEETEESMQCSESIQNQNDAFYDVLDFVEEDDENDDYYCTDEDTSHDSGANVQDKLDFKYEFECDQIRDTNNDAPDDYEECTVLVKPENLNEHPLPDGWKEVYHESGALLYWQPKTNVCCLSRPYFLGPGSTKFHKLPDTAVPCLFYRDKKSTSDVDLENCESSQDKVVKYCERLFKFKKIKYLKFKSWDVRRTYLRTLRNERNRRRCPFSNNKFISFPMTNKDEEGNVVSNKWIITPRGKSYVAILHEYLQQSIKTQPVYSFSEVDNAKTPYAATVSVNGVEYGTGVGMSKKEAKLEAAKATLLVLLPKMKKDLIINNEKQGKNENDSDDEEFNVASIFKDIEIIDPRITLLSKRTTEPIPYELLVKCLQKKNNNDEIKFDFNVESGECTMSVGEHTVTVKCNNKREGKQQAAQALLQALHPYINNWGSLLRLYGNNTTDHYQLGSRQVPEDRDVDEERSRTPNKKLLDSLRNRMKSLDEKEK